MRQVLLNDSAAIPETVTSCVAISGSFKVDFMEWKRYKGLYQRIIAPGLVLKMFAKYGQSMHDYFDGDTIQSLLSVNSYRDISEKVLIKLLQKRGLNVQDFQAWKERCETSFHDRKNISVPFLLITSANDPLHHAAMIGIPLRDEDHAANDAYLVTEQEGT